MKQTEAQKTKNLDLSFLMKTYLLENGAPIIQITSLNIAKLSSHTLFYFLHVAFTLETKANRKLPPTKVHINIHTLLKAQKETN